MTTLVPDSPATAASLTSYTTEALGAVVDQAVAQLHTPDPAWHVTPGTLADIRQTGLDILHQRAVTGFEVRQHHNGIIGWSVLGPDGKPRETGVTYEFACHVATRLRAQAQDALDR